MGKQVNTIRMEQCLKGKKVEELIFYEREQEFVCFYV